MNKDLILTKSIVNYSRVATKKVSIGKINIGDKLPVAVQTMCNTHTSDVEATVNQIVNVALSTECHIIRVTVPTLADVEFLKQIKNTLISKNIDIPIVADVHFNSKVAVECSKIVEKVRINPGNFSDFKNPCLSDAEFLAEADNIEQNLIPFISECKKHNTAVRIGVNHGSLSKRIVNRYGDTPQGMAESAMEFLRNFHKHAFDNLVVSLKASNPFVMVRACRILSNQMQTENLNYPLHLGVTESGEGKEGRLKSYAGICALLSDGIGDTIRVSLTEPPENEIIPAVTIRNYISEKSSALPLPEIPIFFNPFEYSKRDSTLANFNNLFNSAIVSLFVNDNCDVDNLCEFLVEKDAKTPDLVFCNNEGQALKLSSVKPDLKIAVRNSDNTLRSIFFKLYSYNEFLNSESDKCACSFVEVDETTDFSDFKNHCSDNVIFLACPKNLNKTGAMRIMFYNLQCADINNPVIIKPDSGNFLKQYFDVAVSCESAGIFIDGFGDGICLNVDNNARYHSGTMFEILQICRLRISGNEYISCPGCGRTLFDLQTTVKQIKDATSGFKHLKIAVMGCIVNGPGEMADADFGYVGAGVDKITLYKGKVPVESNINQADAVERLLKLINASFE